MKIEHNEKKIIDNFNEEFEFFIYINTCGIFAYNIEKNLNSPIKVGDPSELKKELKLIRYKQEYCVKKLNDFLTYNILERDNKTPNETYWKWYNYWEKWWFELSKNKEKLLEFIELKDNNENIERYLPVKFDPINIDE